jgi:hypothetical protein
VYVQIEGGVKESHLCTVMYQSDAVCINATAPDTSERDLRFAHCAGAGGRVGVATGGGVVSEMYQSTEQPLVLRRPPRSAEFALYLLDGLLNTSQHQPDGLQPDLGAGGRGFKSPLPDQM